MLNQNLLLTGDDGYNLTNSLRFRSSATAFLNRTPSTTSNRRTYTWSAWVKLGRLGIARSLFTGYEGDENFTTSFGFNSLNQIFLGNTVSGSQSNGFYAETIALFRDPSAWYHVVFTIDTTQASVTNALKLYVNGVQQTLQNFGGGTPGYGGGQNQQTFVNLNTAVQRIGQTAPPNTGYFDGYLTEVNFIDGQALTPSSFGSTNPATGVWQPARYTGTYGTNGFYLPFTDNSALTTSSNVGLGRDYSGNGNYWTTNNISITAGTTYDSMTDVPTMSALASNYCVMNPLNTYSTITVSDANLKLTLTQASYRKSVATMAFPSSGLYYLEGTVSGGIDYVSYGIVTPTAPLDDAVGNTATGYGAITGTTNWDKKTNGTTSGNFWTIATSNPTLQIAYNATSGKLWLGYNNIWLDGSGGVTGNPSAGTNETFTVDTTRVYLPSFGGYKSNSIVINLNFGQQPFSYTPPTGFVALNTFNLPTSTIVKGNTVMDVSLYTGTGALTQSVTNSGSMQPDFVWIKDRSQSTRHVLTDVVRGVGKSLYSSTTDAEGTNDSTGYLSAFNSNGFTVNRGSGGLGERVNYTGDAYVGWQWKANGTGVTNTDGNRTSTVSVNATAGFSVVTYTFVTSGTNTVGHGLGVAPAMIIMKDRTTAYNWDVYHQSIGYTQRLILNSTSAATSGFWAAAPTSSVFSVTSSMGSNNDAIVAYCFAQIAGYSAFGSYTGNGSADGTFVHLGFRPRYVLVKRVDAGSSESWFALDTARSPFNAPTAWLAPNLSNAEGTDILFDILSNGFKQRSTSSNANGGTYIYMAFAENPFKNSLAR